MLTPAGWHQRYLQQALWTYNLRSHLYAQAAASQARMILEVGCGTGVLLSELISITPARIYGLDINQTNLTLAAGYAPQAALTCADAHQLPFADSGFDISLCHFLILWVADPGQVIGEMARVTRPGGRVLILAEPDYGGRIDFPPALEEIGKLQTEALSRQGADVYIGRKLRHLMTKAKLVEVEAGVLGGQWADTQSGIEEWSSEWKTIHSDLMKYIPPAELTEFEKIDRLAREKGERILFVPTFYAWGKKPID